MSRKVKHSLEFKLAMDQAEKLGGKKLFLSFVVRNKHIFPLNQAQQTLPTNSLADEGVCQCISAETIHLPTNN